MARYFIEDVKCGVGIGGMACGPVDGPVIGEVKVRTDEGDTFYLCLAEVMGIPNFFKTDESTYEDQMSSDFDEEVTEYLNEHAIVGYDYWDIYSNSDLEYRELWRYLACVVRSSWDECTPFMTATKGKWLDEIEIPVSKYEQEFLDEEDEEEV